MKGYKEYPDRLEILKVADHVAITTTIPDTLGTVDPESGRKIVKAGTVLPANDATARGLLLLSVDVTDGDALGSMLIEGVVYKDRLPAAVAELAKPNLTNIILV